MSIAQRGTLYGRIISRMRLSGVISSEQSVCGFIAGQFVQSSGTAVKVVDYAEEGNMHPITSNAVHVIVGNVEALMGTI